MSQMEVDLSSSNIFFFLMLIRFLIIECTHPCIQSPMLQYNPSEAVILFIGHNSWLKHLNSNRPTYTGELANTVILECGKWISPK